MLLTLASFNIKEVHIEYEVTGYIPIGETYTRVGITDYPIYKTTARFIFCLQREDSHHP